MKSLTYASVLVIFLPLQVPAKEKTALPSPERERLLQNCCRVQEGHRPPPSMLGELRSDDLLRKIVRDKRLLITAIDDRNPENGGFYIGRPPRSADGKTKMKLGIHWSRETGILESPF